MGKNWFQLNQTALTQEFSATACEEAYKPLIKVSAELAALSSPHLCRYHASQGLIATSTVPGLRRPVSGHYQLPRELMVAIVGPQLATSRFRKT